MIAKIFKILKKLKKFTQNHNSNFFEVLARAIYFKFYKKIDLDEQIFTEILDSNTSFKGEDEIIGIGKIIRHQRNLNKYPQCLISDKSVFYYLSKSLLFSHPNTFFLFEYDKNNKLAHGITSDGKNISNEKEWSELIENKFPKKFIVKPSLGMRGQNIDVFNWDKNSFENKSYSFSKKEFYERLFIRAHYRKCIFQEVLENHEGIKNLTSLDTLQCIRILTIKSKNGKINIFSSFFKISTNDGICDNFLGGTSGNMVAVINLNSGKIEKVFGFDLNTLTKTNIIYHPISNKKMIGFPIPFWEKIKKEACDTHQRISGLRAIGWDIGITNSGPVIIEGNPEWAAWGQKGPWFTKRDLNKFLRVLAAD